MKLLCIDFETASMCDLKTAGAWRYAEDITTEVLCLCWQLDGEPGCWGPGQDTSELKQIAADPTVLAVAHNRMFEAAIWRRIMVPVYGFPDIPDERWHDTMAVCAYKSLPLALEKAAHTLGLPDEKDTAASRFTIGLSKPNKAGYFDRSENSISRVVAYCVQDVRAEVALHDRIGWLSPEERKVWLLDQTINQRGVALDHTFVSSAQRVVDGALSPLNARFAELTGVNPGQTAKVLEWCRSQGTVLPNLQKLTIAGALGYDPDDEWEPADDWTAAPLLPAVRSALSIRQLASSASIKKLPRMLACMCGDGRVRGAVQYHAAHTGRWGGRLFQPQNFPKPTVKRGKGWTPGAWQDMLVDAIKTGDYRYVEAVVGNPIEVVLSSLPYAVVAAPDNAFAVGDFAGIEARVVLALAGQHDKTALIAGGLDPYLDFASVVLGRPVTDRADPARQKTGKPGVLGCGFGMGAKKLAAKEGIELAAAQGIVDTYRKDWAPQVPKLWYALENAAVTAVWGGQPAEVFGCQYRLEDGWLTCRMPSGRKLWYWNPQRTTRAVPWDEFDLRRGFTYQTWKNGRAVQVDAYGGSLTENVVQALARDIMVHSMFLCEANNYPVVLTVHDEIICETPAADAAMLQQMMEDRPQWAVAMGCPIAAECWAGARYRKG